MQKSSIIRVGDKVVRKPRIKEFETEVIEESFSNTSVGSRRFESPLLIIYVFGFIISLIFIKVHLLLSFYKDYLIMFHIFFYHLMIQLLLLQLRKLLQLCM